MIRKIQLAVFILVALACAALILTTQPQFRNHIPVFWGIYGVGFHAALNIIMRIYYQNKPDPIGEKANELSNYFKLNLILTLIAFILFAVFGIMTVVMTWKK